MERSERLDFVNRANADYIERLYEQYQRDPRSLDEFWQAYFAGFETAGGRAENLLSLTWYLAEGSRSFMEDAIDVTTAREEVFPGIVTGSTAVRVRSLLTPEILVEIQAVCAL